MFRKPRQQTLKADLTTRVSRCAVCLRGRSQNLPRRYPQNQPQYGGGQYVPVEHGGDDRFGGLPEAGAIQKPGRRTNALYRNPYTRNFDQSRRRHRTRQRLRDPQQQ